MLVFLPPSEAKTTGGDLPPLRGTLGSDALGRARSRVLSEVQSLSRRDPEGAGTSLRIPAGARAQTTAWNRTCLDGPTCPALQRYAGVVYDALDPGSFTPAQRGVADRTVRIFSGGLGYVRADEAVPAYRVPAAATLPRLGALSPWWRTVLREEVATDVGDQLVLDLRSSDYAALWTPPVGLRELVVPVRVLTRRRGEAGVVESVVSYNSKRVKGLLAAALVRAATRGRRFEELGAVVSVAERLGYEVRVRPGARGTTGLEVVEPLATADVQPLTGLASAVDADAP